MIIIGLGANLDSQYGTPIQTLSAAKEALAAQGVTTRRQSRIWRSAPVPFDPAQNWYHNAALSVDTNLSPESLIDLLLETEHAFGRERTVKNAPRILDLDLIAYNRQVVEEEGAIVPHPRMQERLFVLKPLADIDANWVHPVSGADLSALLRNVDPSQEAEPLDESW
jgi:2-amino-4-hydroxy-6-hydroxymethyldihydropteridine diphosphokinase